MSEENVDHALVILKKYHAENKSEVPLIVLEKVYELERQFQFEEDRSIVLQKLNLVLSQAIEEALNS